MHPGSILYNMRWLLKVDMLLGSGGQAKVSNVEIFGQTTNDTKHFEKHRQHAPVTAKGRGEADIRDSHFSKARNLSAKANAAILVAMRRQAAAHEALQATDPSIGTEVVAGSEEEEVSLVASTPKACSPLRDSIVGQPLPRDAILQQRDGDDDDLGFSDGDGDSQKE